MEGIIPSHIFVKAKYSASLHSCVLLGWWPQPLQICCKTIELPGCLISAPAPTALDGPQPTALLNH